MVLFKTTENNRLKFCITVVSKKIRLIHQPRKVYIYGEESFATEILCTKKLVLIVLLSFYL